MDTDYISFSFIGSIDNEEMEFASEDDYIEYLNERKEVDDGSIPD